MKPKLEDVAKLANVSKTTVSRVLNKRGYLSQETIDKVNDAMKTLKTINLILWRANYIISRLKLLDSYFLR